MYNRKGYSGNCSWKTVKNIQSSAISKEAKKEALGRVFNLSGEEVEHSLRRVISAFCLSEYFRYKYGKEITEAKQKELLAIIQDPTSYSAWRPTSRKIPFPSLCSAAEFLMKEMK